MTKRKYCPLKLAAMLLTLLPRLTAQAFTDYYTAGFYTRGSETAYYLDSGDSVYDPLYLPIRRIALVHRLGDLVVGDTSVALALSSGHRRESFEASRHIMEELKKRLPVWKHERYADGSTEWAAGMEPSR